MSIYYSKWDLNTYKGTPYFEAHCPPDFPVNLALQKCRAFRRLPPTLRELSARAKAWAAKHYPYVVEDVSRGYDAAGNELDLSSGKPLTDAQIDAQWPWPAPDVEVTDIPLPAGGFPDPEAWQPPEVPGGGDEPGDEDGPTEGQIRSDIASHGLTRAARDYGVPDAASDEALVRAVLTRKRGRP